MKIRKVISLIIMLCVLLSLPCTAEMNGRTRIEYEEEKISVIFPSESTLTESEKQELADRLVYGTQELEIMPASILCSLFGHDISTNQVVAIHHKVRSTSPRCYKEYITVETCSRCDYENSTVTSHNYIYCCPVD